MLEQIRVRNFALIDELVLEFHPELNVFTGETGAGKTILIDALSIALGERFDSTQVRLKDQSALVEAVFDVRKNSLKNHFEIKPWLVDGDDSFIIRREITPDGKNKCSLNGQTVNVSALRQVGKYLADFHGQHDHQQLLDQTFHLGMLDRLTHLENDLARYQTIFSEYSKLKKEREELKSLDENRERECDLLKYQMDEIEKIDPKENEDIALKEEHVKLANAEKLHEITSKILNLFSDEDGSVTEKLGICAKDLSLLSKIDETTKPFVNQMTEAEIAIGDVARAVQDYRDNLSFDEDRLKEIEDRLDDLEKIKRKYGRSISAALQFLLKTRERYELLANFTEKTLELDKKISQLEKKLKTEAAELTAKRKRAAQKLKTVIEKELNDLGIPKAKFECRVELAEPSETGLNRVEFFVSLNVGETVLPLAKIISGGEASRVMLAMKRALIDTDQIPTMIFDEIDANIGGRLGSTVGEKLSEISKKHQILLITHLPQIASFAKRHIKVSKVVEGKRTKTSYAVIEGNARVKELSEMFSGEKETKISVEHARELLESRGG